MHWQPQNGGLNYSLAKVIHWLRSSDGDGGWTTRVKDSEKEPLEDRVWYSYAGQPPCGGDSAEFGVSSSNVVTSGASNKPIAIGRVLDSGASQVQLFQYNSNGNLVQSTDPVGRQTSFTYASNGVDQLTTKNTTSGSQLLETRTYNSDHLPLTITGANGKTAHYKYNAAGQPTQYTDPLGRVTTMTYDGEGHLKTVQGAISAAKYTLAYDSTSRIAAVTDPAGATVHYTYDAADRALTATLPDGTTRRATYNLLDLATSSDRLGQTTHYKYDANRELIEITDPDGNSANQDYNPAGKLRSITDANSHTTIFTLDDESRVTGKQFANGTSLNIRYESNLSRIATLTDALSQTKDFTYNADNSTATISYQANQTTPTVSFTYDSAYMRPTSMTDGIGTTEYSYYPVSSSPSLGANQLESIASPVAGTASSDLMIYSYDALNRVVGTVINGALRSIGYDALGRLSSASNMLDSFVYSYADGTSRITATSSNAGPSVTLSYFGPTGDELLEQLSYTTHSGGTSLAQYGYAYNADDMVKSLTVTSPSAQVTSFGYDAANRLTSGLIGTGSPQYAYVYDHASNLTSITPDGATQSFTYTSTNAITSGAYDSNGSLISLGGNSYKWDGENRVVRFASGSNNTGSSFSYDGLGRLVRVVDTHGSSIVADHSYLWCGPNRCLAHDNTQAGSPVSTQYFEQGMILGATPYYYIKDKLGSVMDLVSNTGSLAAQYVYDPYGNQSIFSGTITSDIGYAGYFYHAASKLDFALFRAYDPSHARWLNRDPIGERGGLNLYAYADESPVSKTDPSGLAVNFGACVSTCATTFGLTCLRPGVAIGVCGLCALLPPPWDVACAGRCLVNPVVNCIGVATAVCIAGCGIASICTQ